MSLYDKASLVQIPSGTKDGTLYSVLPANGNGDFTHTRASSATRVNKDGLIESVASGVPRLDYPLIGGVVQSCPALLLEPSRKNDLTYSEFTNADPVGWTLGFGTGTYDYDLVSYKGRGALKQTQTTIGRSYQYQNVTLLASTTYTLSMYVDISNSNVTNLGEDIMHVIADDETGDNTAEWQDIDTNTGRVSITFTTGSDTSVQIRIGLGVTGNTLAPNQVLTYSMPQLEAGSYPTSYIPTSGSSVTRSADVCNGAGTSAEFNDTESSWFVELQGLAEDNTNKYISISDGGGSPYTNSLSIQYRNNGTLRIFHNGLDFADAIFVGGSSFDLTENHKIAIRFKENDMAVYIDGVSQSLSGSFVYQSISGLNTLRFEQPNAGNAFYGKVKQLMVFNEALTDAELATLTS